MRSRSEVISVFPPWARYYGEIKVYAASDTERTHPLTLEEIDEMRK